MRIIEPTYPEDDGTLRIGPARGAVIFDPWPFNEDEVRLATYLYATVDEVEHNEVKSALDADYYNVPVSYTHLTLPTKA